VDDIPGYSHLKIKEAYGLKKADTEQQLVDQGVTDQHRLESQGREAGRAATLAAVRTLTGVPIDYFAEISLASFYDLAVSLGGVDVCLNRPVSDDYSVAKR
jgi:anionic cell wall polymer biosynthesis LytR-Cps2A-Psr (LCP) family protein